MKKRILLIVNSLLLAACIQAQTETFDIATFIPPNGWERTDTNGIVIFQNSKTNNGLTTFCQIFIHPSHKSTGNAAADFSAAWNDLVVSFTKTANKPKTETTKSSDGWIVTTGYSYITLQGATFTCMLITASGFDKTMNILINVTGQDYTTTITDFLNNLKLDAEATVSTGKTGNPSTASLDQYSFIAPESWTAQQGNGYILYSQPDASGLGCKLTLFVPQSSSSNLENDVKQLYNQMYTGWKFYYSDDRHDELQKGITKQGLEYYMMEAEMVKARGESWDYEKGTLLVISIGKQIAVVAVRHEPTGIHCQCKQRYDYWGRFFTSFTVKNFSSKEESKEDIMKRIPGSWMTSGNRSIGEYIFAANGRYQFIGGYGTFTQVSPTILELKTSAFKGDGSYKLNGDQLILTKQGSSKPEIYRFRFEKVNKGSTGWKDRIFLLNETPLDGGNPYEVCYERSVRK